MSDMDEAYAELIEAIAETFPGTLVSVLIAGNTYENCFLPEEPSEFEFTGGGIRDATTPEIWIAASQLTGKPPLAEGQKATIDGRELDVLGPLVNKRTHTVVTLGEIDPGEE